MWSNGDCRLRVAGTEAVWLQLVGKELGENEPRFPLLIVLQTTDLWETIKE